MANPGLVLLVAVGVLLVVRLGLPGIRAKRPAGDKGAVSAETAMVDHKTGDPAVGWMGFYEAVRLAEEYALPLKEMTSKVAATRLVGEFIERRRDHYDERTRFVGGMVVLFAAVMSSIGPKLDRIARRHAEKGGE